jgi:2-C-methyl-D-erythritol 4-phosphate cytidylyltransferase/2-C-methyl-D-erythritol 2,4-cyclodiphosphate synthase
VPVTDSLKRADDAGGGARSVERAGLWRAQTPQGFAFAPILAAHRAAAAAGQLALSDDAAVAE